MVLLKAASAVVAESLLMRSIDLEMWLNLELAANNVEFLYA